MGDYIALPQLGLKQVRLRQGLFLNIFILLRLFYRRDVTFAEAVESHWIVVEHLSLELIG